MFPPSSDGSWEQTTPVIDFPVERHQRASTRSRTREPPPDDDEELAWDEVEEDHPADTVENVGVRRFLPSIRFLSSMAALGIVLALGWRYSGVEKWAIGALQPTTASQTATGSAASAPESDMARSKRELEALKKTVGELAAANQEMAAKIAALQAGQQDLRQRPSGPPLTPWYSDLTTMKYRMVSERRTTGSIASRAPAAGPSRAARRSPANTRPSSSRRRDPEGCGGSGRGRAAFGLPKTA